MAIKRRKVTKAGLKKAVIGTGKTIKARAGASSSLVRNKAKRLSQRGGESIPALRKRLETKKSFEAYKEFVKKKAKKRIMKLKGK